MKKIILGFFFIFLGFFLGKLWFLNINLSILSKRGEKYFFLQEGVYYSNEKLSNYENGIIEEKDDKVIVYKAITRNLDVAWKIIEYYKEKNIQLSIKEKYLSNEEFKNNVEQFDLLIESSTDNDEIMKIEEVVLANYEEIIKYKY